MYNLGFCLLIKSLYLYYQGLTFPVQELFLEDVLEKTRYVVKSESDNYQGYSRKRGRQQETKTDPITEQFEVCL